MPAPIDLTGQRFGRLVVTSFYGTVKRFRRWNCRCDCGKDRVVAARELRAGDTRSCGCLHDEVAGARYRGKRTGPSGHRKDISRQRFGKLVVAGYSHTVRQRHSYVAYWQCRCDCGGDITTSGHWLRCGRVISCGCVKANVAGDRNRTHGMSGGNEHRCWAAMLTRCTNPNHKNWHRYGGRGIKVCERWKSFENFLADMGPRPSLRHSIERENNDGDYEPDNCRWATQKEQCRNRIGLVLITIEGQTRCLREWGELAGCTPRTTASIWRDARLAAAAEGSDPKETKAAREHIRSARRLACQWCGRNVPRRLRHIDHIVPLDKGGREAAANLCCACPTCNRAKHNKSPEAFSGQAVLLAPPPDARSIDRAKRIVAERFKRRMASRAA